MINTLGDAESKANYKEELIKYFTPHKDDLCSDCNERMEKNPLRVLDCKKDSGKEFFNNAPRMVDYLNETSSDFFNQLQTILKELGVEFEINHKLVRGLDYYTHTIFEIQADIEGFGSQNTLCGGGRYNKLVDVFDGPETPGIGFGMGMERLLLALELEEIKITQDPYVHAYIAPLAVSAKPKGLEIANELRMRGLVSEIDMLDRRMKAHFKQADRLNARFIVFIGEEELENGNVNIKDLQTKEQVTVTFDKVYEYIYKELTQQSHCGKCKG
jgi:histidyl-tRNA synthetase